MSAPLFVFNNAMGLIRFVDVDEGGDVWEELTLVILSSL